MSTYEDRTPAYSPDGRRIAFSSARSGEDREIWLADADGRNLIQLTRGPGSFRSSPRWSPDGRRIVYDARGDGGVRDLWTIDVTGGAPRRLTDGPMNSGLACWSPDGRWIYYRSFRADGADIWRLPAEGGTPEQVTRQAGQGPRFTADRCAVSYDGRTLYYNYYNRADGEAPLVAHPLDGQPERVVTDCVAGRGFDTGPDGVYYVGCGTRLRARPLYRLDPYSGRQELLGRVETDYVDTIAVSPTGGPILFPKLTIEGDVVMIENFR